MDRCGTHLSSNDACFLVEQLLVPLGASIVPSENAEEFRYSTFSRAQKLLGTDGISNFRDATTWLPAFFFVALLS